MAKKNEIVKKTPEMLAKAQERMIAIDASIENHLNGINKGYLSIAPLIAEVYDNEYFVVKGYKNIDDYAEAEHAMSHGTVSGLRKVFARFGSTKENEDGTKSYTIPDKYLDWGYTKLHLIASDEQKFKDAGIEPFEVFTPDMTIKAMKDTLALKLEDKAKKQDESAIDTTAKEVDNSASDNSASDNSASDNSASDSDRQETFKNILDGLKADIEHMRDYLKNDINEVKTCADTIKGQIATLEKTYNKAHATATVKDTKKNK
jgi:hypothetical protein